MPGCPATLKKAYYTTTTTTCTNRLTSFSMKLEPVRDFAIDAQTARSE